MVTLQPISEADFAAYLAEAIRGYAADKITAGAWAPDRALERSERTFQQFLPQGLATPDQYVYSIRSDEGIAVGVLWFGVYDYGAGPTAFLSDFVILQPFRRRGYGRQALEALEVKVRELGLAKIALHVFGHNSGARALYEKMGYGVTDLSMAKTLPPVP